MIIIDKLVYVHRSVNSKKRKLIMYNCVFIITSLVVLGPIVCQGQSILNISGCEQIHLNHRDDHDNIVSPLELRINNCSNIEFMSNIQFDHFKDLILLQFLNSPIRTIKNGALNEFNKLKTISMINSNLSDISSWSNTSLLAVQVIDLQMNLIEEITEKSFTHYPNLMQLNLSFNRIYRLINGSFKSTPYIESLNLSSNLIRKIQAHLLQPLLKLKSLDLHRNQIEYLDSYTFATTAHLEYLNLSENKLKKIDKLLLFNLPHLKYLNVSENILNNLEVGVFSQNTYVTVLDLSHNNMSNFDVGSLNGLLNLEYFNVKKNKLAYINPAAFSDLQNIKSFDASHNRLSFLNKEHFLHMHRLININLSANTIETIHKDSFSGLKEIRTVDLAHNHLHEAFFLNDLKVDNALNLSYNRFKTINSTLLTNINNVELIGNYWQCSWLIPELFYNRLHHGVHFVVNANDNETSKGKPSSIYDEIDCYAYDGPDETPVAHSLRHIVVLRRGACIESNQNKSDSINKYKNLYRRAFNKLVGEDFDFRYCLIWVVLGIATLLALTHFAKSLSNNLDKRKNKMYLDQQNQLHREIEEYFLRANGEPKTRE